MWFNSSMATDDLPITSYEGYSNTNDTSVKFISEFNDNIPVEITNTLELNPMTTEQVTIFVTDALKTVVSTEFSVHSCAASFQNNFGQNTKLISLCILTMVSFYLTTDNTTRRNVFYVVNDLVQYDPRFRIPVLQYFIPKSYPIISGMYDKEIYIKTVSVWQKRNIFSSEICQTLESLFQIEDMKKQNARELRERLNSFIDIARIRAVKDKDLEQLFEENSCRNNYKQSCSSDGKTAIAATIMAASNSELKTMIISARTGLLVTQSAIEYLARLLIDFDNLSTFNREGMEEIMNILNSCYTTQKI